MVTPSEPEHIDPAADPWAAARSLLHGGRLSILMPAHNLGPVIGDNLRVVHRLLAGRLPFEIIPIDDGSTDDTADGLRAAQREFPECRPVWLPQNVGKGAALRHGFEASTGSLIVFLDGDLDLPPDQLPHFFGIMLRERADIVIGSKRHPRSDLDYPWHRRLFSAVYYGMVKLLFGLPVRDTQTGLKVFKRAALQWAFPRILVKAFAFDLELLAVVHQRGYRVAEAPVRVNFQGTWGCVQPSIVRAIIIDTLAVFYRLRLLRYYQSIPDLAMPQPPPRVSVVMALPRPSAYLDEALAGIAAQSMPPLEVILLPDEPSGRDWPAPIREIPTGVLRPAEKRNLGIRAAQGDVVAFLDDDACPQSDWLERALGYFNLPDMAAVGGPAITPANDSTLAQLGGRVLASRMVSGPCHYRYTAHRVLRVDDLPSCNLLIRRDVLEKLGGFSTVYWPGEDTILCARITHELGMAIYYDPLTVVTHHRRPLYLPHLRQVGRYGLHRGYFARHIPQTSRRPSYFLPTALLAGLVSAPLAAWLWTPLRPWLGAGIGFYLAATLLASLSRRLRHIPLIWLGIVATHAVYGFRFAQGFMRRRMPEGVQAFDHPSEVTE